jgi:4-hydroxy-3-methylbut-2-enyl diphosphate reductase IspH
MGEVPDQVKLIQTAARPRRFEVPDPSGLAYATQTLLRLDDVAGIVDTSRRRFPHIVGPEGRGLLLRDDEPLGSVQALVEHHAADLVLVLGSPNSSNSNRPARGGRGCRRAGVAARRPARSGSTLARRRAPRRQPRRAPQSPSTWFRP